MKTAVESPVAEARRLHERALALHGEGRTAEAEEPARQAFTVLAGQLDPDDPEIAGILITLGGLREALGDLASAEGFYRSALRLLEGQGDEVLRLRVQALGMLANLRQAQGRYGAAEKLYLRALAVAEAAFAPEDMAIAALLNGFRNSAMFCGQDRQAGGHRLEN